MKVGGCLSSLDLGERDGKVSKLDPCRRQARGCSPPFFFLAPKALNAKTRKSRLVRNPTTCLI